MAERTRPETSLQSPRTSADYERTIAELRREVERVERERDRLCRDNERLKEKLEMARRARARQAAPFSKGAPTARPRRPGRKPGTAYVRRGPARRLRRVIHETHAPRCPGLPGAVIGCVRSASRPSTKKTCRRCSPSCDASMSTSGSVGAATAAWAAGPLGSCHRDVGVHRSRPTPAHRVRLAHVTDHVRCQLVSSGQLHHGLTGHRLPVQSNLKIRLLDLL